MVGAKKMEQYGVQYELEIEILAPVDQVWHALIEDVNVWWLGDFHMVDADSTVEFDVLPGGKGLVEHLPDGSFLQWYVVQAFLPKQRKIYLVGNLAPDFGGPSTTNLLLELIPQDNGCLLKIKDAHHGCVNEQTIGSLEQGWRQLFDDGLRRYVEGRNSVPQD